MKRYAVFGNDIHYAGGGFSDFIGDYNNREEAIRASALPQMEGDKWSHVIDTVAMICIHAEGQAYGGRDRDGINKSLGSASGWGRVD